MKKFLIMIVLLLTFTTQSKSQVLNISDIFQEQTGWCWASVCSTILDYYNHPKSQCELVEYLRKTQTTIDYGDVNCCDDPNQGCNNGGTNNGIAHILEYFGGIKTEVLYRHLTLEEMKADINDNKLFIIIRRPINRYTTHVMVGHGLIDSSLYYHNPWVGTGFKIENYLHVYENEKYVWNSTIRIKSISDSIPLAINNVESKTDFKIFPNPTSQNLVIETNKYKIQNYEILNLNGNIILNGTIYDRKIIDVRDLSSGIYIIKVYDENGFNHKKFIKF